MTRAAAAVAVAAAWAGLGGTALAQQSMIIDAKYGVTRFSGTLSGDAAAPTYGIDLEFRDLNYERQIHESSWLSRNLQGFGAGVLLSFLQIDAHARADTPWPVQPASNVSLFATGIGSRFCVLTIYDVHPCGRLLIGSLDVSHSSSWHQTYGTDSLGLSVEALALRVVHVTAEVEWRDQSQAVDGKTTSFEARSETLGVGYVF